MKKMIILAASLMIFAGTAVSCGKNSGSSSEGDTSSSDTSSNKASSGKYTFEEAEKRAGESVRKKSAEALVYNLLVQALQLLNFIGEETLLYFYLYL